MFLENMDDKHMGEKKYFTKEYIEELFLKFVGCSSISGTKEEVDMGNLIYDHFQRHTYFQKHPEYLNRHFISNDKFGRFAVTAMVKGKGKRTVILLNHFDIVDYEGFGNNKEYALRPKELIRHLNHEDMSEDARKDLLSGNWIFGRGTGDMKFGGAMEAALVLEASESPDFDGNLIFLGVPDEENNSAGMLAAIPALNEMKKKYDLNYVAVINSEPHSKENGTHCMDLGGVGKIMPAVFCVGKEGHSGMLFNALNAVPMLSEILTDIEFSTEFLDSLEGVFTIPPTTLKINDNKTLYNVTMPYVAYSYFTVSTLTMTAADITEKLKKICSGAMGRLNVKIKNFYQEYERLTGEGHDADWLPAIYTYAELYQRNRVALGDDFVKHIDDFAREQADLGFDERDATVNIVKEVIRIDPEKEPKIVIAYIPPFYSHTVNHGKTENEKYLWECAEKVKAFSEENFGEKWKLVKICKQISDSSCCNVGDMSAEAKYLEPNMPLLGNMYNLPLKELQMFDVPPINIGYYAKDLHEPFERMDREFALNVAPKLLEYAVSILLKPEGGAR